MSWALPAVDALAARLLEDRLVDAVLGWARDPDLPWQRYPHRVDEPSRVGELVWDPFCAPGLAKLVFRMTEGGLKLGVLARGCDALGVWRLIHDRRIARENVYLLGLPCPGMADGVRVWEECPEAFDAAGWEDHGSHWVAVPTGIRLPKERFLLDKCLQCQVRWPRQCDEVLAVQGGSWNPFCEDRYRQVRQLEELPLPQRFDFWRGWFERCLRCFACRQVCPACNCESCSLDQFEPNWLEREVGVATQFIFHFTRALHVAGRCVDCGECQRACPVGFPLGALNRKMMKDMEDLFGVREPFVPQESEPLGEFALDDPDEFR